MYIHRYRYINHKLPFLSSSCSGKVVSPPPAFSVRPRAAITIFLTRQNLENTKTDNDGIGPREILYLFLHSHFHQKKHMHQLGPY